MIAEAAYMLNRQSGPIAELALYDSILKVALVVEDLVSSDWQRIRTLVEQYRDMPLGGTDASLVALAERFKIVRVATLDHRHFGVVRPKHCDAFELLP